MVKAVKYIILAAGALGILAFFMPLVAVRAHGMEGKLSAYQIIKGVDKAGDVVDGADMSTVEARESVRDADNALSAVKGIVLAIFAPALFLIVFGAIGVKRKAFGRGLAIPSLIFGLLGLGIWALLASGAEDSAGIGLHMLLVTALCGLIGGLVATVKPDRRLAA